jgi:hypothetical protein
MYGNEYVFRGRIPELIAAVDTYAKRVTYRYTPGPYTPADIFRRLVPEAVEYDSHITYAEFQFSSRFTTIVGHLFANSLPAQSSLLVVDIPEWGYESDYSRLSLQWAWEGLEKYFARHGWLDEIDPLLLSTPNPSELLPTLVTRFSEEELKTLCFRLTIDFDSLPGVGRESKARELLMYLHRRQKIADLIRMIDKHRPDVELTALLRQPLEHSRQKKDESFSTQFPET